MNLMRDSDIRTALLGALDAQYAHDHSTRVVEEMGIWSGSVRIDVAVINGELHGFELKSERDTLRRLPGQAELYNQVFDRVTLVIAKKHLEHASDQIPEWWGLTIAAPDAGGIILSDHRQASSNPDLNPMQLARLLWRSEILEILERHQLAKGLKSKPLEVLVSRLANTFGLNDLRDEVRNRLKHRASLRQTICHDT
jgi:hypothetical protein